MNKVNSADQRTLSTLSYFHQMVKNTNIEINNKNKNNKLWWDFSGIVARKPFCVPFQHVKVAFVHENVPDCQVLKSLDTTIVGLEIIGGGAYENTSNCGGAPIHSVNNSMLGLIRGIQSNSNGEIILLLVSAGYISLQEISHVNLILRGGAIETPVSFYVNGIEENRNLPYASFMICEGIGSAMRRPRKNVLRKRFIL
jgi:hypothetical protein